MRISEYPEISSVFTSDKLLLDGERGAKSVSAESLARAFVEMTGGTSSPSPSPDPGSIDLYSIIDALNIVELHRTVYRGKFLGNSFTSDQKETIKNGTFADLFLGDYWTINGITWRIVDFDYWMGLIIYKTDGTSNEQINKHHLAIMPDYLADSNGVPMVYGYENAEDLATKGYAQSSLRTKVTDEIIHSTISVCFGDSFLLDIPEYLTCRKEVGTHFDSDSQIKVKYELPTLYMLTGASGFLATNPHADPFLIVADPGTGRGQLSLFRVSPKSLLINRIVDSEGFWTRTLVGSTSDEFVVINHNGLAITPSYLSNYDIRPFFGVTGGI